MVIYDRMYVRAYEYRLLPLKLDSRDKIIHALIFFRAFLNSLCIQAKKN